MKAEWQEHEVASHITFAVRKQRELDSEALLTFSVLSLGPQAICSVTYIHGVFLVPT